MILAGGASARRAVLHALIRLPEAVRKLALDNVLFVVVGRTGGSETRGWSIPAACYSGASHVIPLLAHEEMANVLAHECGHVVSGTTGADGERDAATLAHLWNFTGHAADPDQCVRDFDDPAAAANAIVDGDAVELRCKRCDSPMVPIAPTAPGLRADLGAECRRCERVDMFNLADLVPCECGARASVEWTPDATPEIPVATWTCGSCNATATRAIQSAPAPHDSAFDLIVPIPDEAPWRYFARSAARVLTLKDGDPAWARRQVRRALAEMDGDPRRGDVQAALDVLTGGDNSGGAAALALALDDSRGSSSSVSDTVASDIALSTNVESS